MAKAAERGTRSGGKTRQQAGTTARGRGRTATAKPTAQAAAVSAPRADWATDLVFDVREPKLAVSLRLDADVLRFFRGFGAGYQTRINEVLKAFMHAREGMEVSAHVASAKSSRGATNGKRVR
ncbi:MAG: BrnA antitoxin family protein [Acetobacteraceae bacterium]|nr:BrnA antitoxin family protein [Pseudomonadota bacterium]